MATGYTYPVRAGQITDFSTFAWFCAKGIDVFCRDRDTNRPIGWIPTEAELAEICGDNDYYEKQIVIAKKDLFEFYNCSDDDWRKKQAQDIDQAVLHYEQTITTNELRRARYTSMLSKVADWTPPTEDHVHMKEFMISQLKDSLNSDMLPLRSPEETLEEYKFRKISTAQRMLSYFEEQDLDCKQTAKERREWITALARSLGQEIR